MDKFKASTSNGECSDQQYVVIEKENSSTNNRLTPEIEKKHVHDVYNAITPHFDCSRHAKWPEVLTFLHSLPPNSLVLDAGCGNGKYLGSSPDSIFIGCDICPSLMEICSNKGHEVVVADAVSLPYRSNFGDAAISVAVLHHLSTEQRRRKAIEELVRVVKKGGLVLITVWAVEQENSSLVKKWTPLTDKFVEECSIGPGSQRMAIEENADHMGNNHSLLSENGKDTEKQQEYFAPWCVEFHRKKVPETFANAVVNSLAREDVEKGGFVFDRYYHLFGKSELRRLCDMENAVIVKQFFDNSNWYIILEKTL